jgi:glycosidase
MEQAYPPPFMPVYVFSNHDRVRSIQRLGNDVRKAKLLHMLQLTVRGVPCVYYGEEIGMTDAKLPFATALDPVARNLKFAPRLLTDALGIKINRDEVRTPMQWDTTKNAGFSTAERTWLPVHENYRQINVETESKDEHSLLNAIRGIMKIRNQERALQEGSLQLMEGLPKNVLGFIRFWNGERCIILLNFDDQENEISNDAAECIFKLSEESALSEKTIKLHGFGGVILK